MKKPRLKSLSVLLIMISLVFILFGCGTLSVWVGVTVPLPVIEIEFGNAVIPLALSSVSMEPGEKFKAYPYAVHIALSDDAKGTIGNRQILDLEISIDASLTSNYSTPVHVELYASDSTITSADDISSQDLIWQGEIQSGVVAKETINLSNAPGLQHVIDILNSTNKEGDIYVAAIHNYDGTDQATGTFDLTVTKVKLTLF